MTLICPICGQSTQHNANAKVAKCVHCFRSFELEPRKMKEETRSEQQEWVPVGDNSIQLSDGTFVTCYNRISRDVILRVHANDLTAALTTEQKHYDLNLAVWGKDNADLRQKLTAERQRHEQLEGDYQKIVTEVLKCNPISASQRSDDQLEPPWEVIARVRQQLFSALAAIERAVNELSSFNAYKVLKILKSVDLSLLHEHDREVKKPLLDLLKRAADEMEQKGMTENSLLSEIDDALAKVKESEAK
jgi:hypothetical protein